MKNEQQNNQNGKQDQKVTSAIPTEQDQQKKKDDWTNKSTGKNQPSTSSQSSGSQSQSLGNEKSNIGVDNQGKIGKAHDQWTNDNNNRNEQPDRTGSNNGNEQPNRNTNQQNIDQQKGTDQQKDKQVRSDKTVTEPEIDAPIYDPEKTEKKIPQMGSNK